MKLLQLCPNNLKRFSPWAKFLSINIKFKEKSLLFCKTRAVSLTPDSLFVINFFFNIKRKILDREV